ncbi:MAG: GDSL-type esterase/lipase family protein [Bacteroidota bacterium]|nr:GDSL-type esterase/lipase family protein [Bacteroidota bacterium]
MRNKFFNLFLFLLFAGTAFAQPYVIDRSKYSFLPFEKNKLYLPETANAYPLFESLRKLMLSGEEQVNIVHIGDSHIQADYFSGRLRELFQTTFPGGNGGRGFVFPYTLAHTNNPVNYKVTYTGSWSGCRNVEYNRECLLGLAGISATTNDDYSTFTISTVMQDLPYDYSRIRLYYDAPDGVYQVMLLQNDLPLSPSIDSVNNIFEWNLLTSVTEVKFEIKRKASQTGAFTVLGVALETRDPGIVYHAIGVNGAEVRSFLRCSLFSKQLRTLNPSLIILSLGTNDAYTASFSSKDFEESYRKLIQDIKLHNPTALIMLTTPGDCYRYRKYPNPNNSTAGDVIHRLALEEKVAVWDFYTAMGGLGSIQKWYTHGLSAADRVHLTRPGYYLQAELFYEAFLMAFDDYLDLPAKN